jgi:hypothetical protein
LRPITIADCSHLGERAAVRRPQPMYLPLRLQRRGQRKRRKTSQRQRFNNACSFKSDAVPVLDPPLRA